MTRQAFEATNDKMLADAARNPAMPIENRKLAAMILQERGATFQIQHPQIAKLLWSVAAETAKVAPESAKKTAKSDTPEPIK